MFPTDHELRRYAIAQATAKRIATRIAQQIEPGMSRPVLMAGKRITQAARGKHEPTVCAYSPRSTYASRYFTPLKPSVSMSYEMRCPGVSIVRISRIWA